MVIVDVAIFLIGVALISLVLLREIRLLANAVKMYKTFGGANITDIADSAQEVVKALKKIKKEKKEIDEKDDDISYGMMYR